MVIEQILSRVLENLNRRSMRLEAITGHAFFPRPPPQPCQLYLHIPFCEHLCPFCSFHREKLFAPKARAYFQALRHEIDLYHQRGFRFHTVYVGGGTPTVLPEELGETLDHIRATSPVRQISVETNPDHLHDRVLDVLKKARVNRLSVGIQSFDDALLQDMERLSRYGSGKELIARLQQAVGRFDTLNADLIFNLPRQSADSLAYDLEVVRHQISLDQVSFYPLMTAASTSKAIRHALGHVTHDHEKSFYYQIVDGLKAVYTPSSAWNFSRTSGMIDEYIVADVDYVGIGSGAFGQFGGVMFANTFSIDGYIAALERGQSPLAGRKVLSRREQMRYDLLMQLFGLRMDVRGLNQKYGDFAREAWKELLAFKTVGAIEQDGTEFRLTRRGMYYWVVMMREFFTGVNRFREQMIAQARLSTRAIGEPEITMAGGSDIPNSEEPFTF